MDKNSIYCAPVLETVNVSVESGFAASPDCYGIDSPDMEFGGEF